LETDGFEDIGKLFEAAGGITFGDIGSAKSQLMSQRALVDHAAEWIRGRMQSG